MVKYFSFITVLAALFLISCAHKNADNLMEAGLYEDAIAAYENYLDNDPEDFKAMIGLRKAQNQFVDKALIQVRMLRLGSNYEASLKLLNEILEKEKVWKLKLNYQITTTQVEEINEAKKRLVELANTYIKVNHFIKANEFLKGYPHILNTKENPSGIDELTKKLQILGKKKCFAFSRQIRVADQFTNVMVNAYCLYWGSNEVPATADCGEGRFGNISIDIIFKYGVNDYLKKEYYEKLIDRIKNGFKDSIFYDPMSDETIVFQGDGNFDYRYTSNPERMMKEYTVQIPYQASVPQIETIQEPYEALELVMEPYQDCYYDYYYERNVCNTRQRMVNKTVTKYRTNYVTRNIIVTKYRDEPRVFYHGGKRHKEIIHLDFHLEGNLNGQNVSIIANESDNNTSISHNASFPDAGLVPERAELIDVPEWLDSIYAKVKDEFVEQLKEVWIMQNCKNIETIKNECERIEKINRCAQGTPDNIVVNTWYKNEFGYEYSDYWERAKRTSKRDVTGQTH